MHKKAVFKSLNRQDEHSSLQDWLNIDFSVLTISRKFNNPEDGISKKFVAPDAIHPNFSHFYQQIEALISQLSEIVAKKLKKNKVTV
ncbi:hypothetical protein C8N47_105206 [Mangrovibacterium marinum]|uniref:Uncharacterized protein n=1 Tax=Mangrovibacterium marinum TaxID=1639118 RepID=A0A2T5C3Q0_9BACT|nr:hypothetical protein C8N47_105206 [Mangrovibacterium marinum]